MLRRPKADRASLLQLIFATHALGPAQGEGTHGPLIPTHPNPNLTLILTPETETS